MGRMQSILGSLWRPQICGPAAIAHGSDQQSMWQASKVYQSRSSTKISIKIEAAQQLKTATGQVLQHKYAGNTAVVQNVSWTWSFDHIDPYQVAGKPVDDYLLRMATWPSSILFLPHGRPATHPAALPWYQPISKKQQNGFFNCSCVKHLGFHCVNMK